MRPPEKRRSGREVGGRTLLQRAAEGESGEQLLGSRERWRAIICSFLLTLTASGARRGSTVPGPVRPDGHGGTGSDITSEVRVRRETWPRIRIQNSQLERSMAVEVPAHVAVDVPGRRLRARRRTTGQRRLRSPDAPRPNCSTQHGVVQSYRPAPGLQRTTGHAKEPEMTGCRTVVLQVLCCWTWWCAVHKGGIILLRVPYTHSGTRRASISRPMATKP